MPKVDAQNSQARSLKKHIPGFSKQTSFQNLGGVGGLLCSCYSQTVKDEKYLLIYCKSKADPSVRRLDMPTPSPLADSASLGPQAALFRITWYVILRVLTFEFKNWSYDACKPCVPLVSYQPLPEYQKE